MDHLKTRLESRQLKTPVNDKLLSRPPFRYLYDLTTELNASGSFKLPRISIDSVTKEDKMAYLDAIISSTNATAKSNKIVAGAEVEETWRLLELVLDYVDHYNATVKDKNEIKSVKRDLERTKKQDVESSNPSKKRETSKATKSQKPSRSNVTPEPKPPVNAPKSQRLSKNSSSNKPSSNPPGKSPSSSPTKLLVKDKKESSTPAESTVTATATTKSSSNVSKTPSHISDQSGKRPVTISHQMPDSAVPPRQQTPHLSAPQGHSTHVDHSASSLLT